MGGRRLMKESRAGRLISLSSVRRLLVKICERRDMSQFGFGLTCGAATNHLCGLRASWSLTRIRPEASRRARARPFGSLVALIKLEIATHAEFRVDIWRAHQGDIMAKFEWPV